MNRFRKRAVIVGAGSGMGRAVAERLVDDEFELVLADVNEDRPNHLAERLGATALVGDIDSPDTRAALVRAAGITDVLVLAAGISATMGTFDEVLDVNLVATASLLHAFDGRIAAGGAAVCIASMGGHMLPPLDEATTALLDAPMTPDLGRRLAELVGPERATSGFAYALSKLGVIPLARRVGVEWGRHAVRVVSVSPGLIDTPMGNSTGDRRRGALLVLRGSVVHHGV